MSPEITLRRVADGPSIPSFFTMGELTGVSGTDGGGGGGGVASSRGQAGIHHLLGGSRVLKFGRRWAHVDPRTQV